MKQTTILVESADTASLNKILAHTPGSTGVYVSAAAFSTLYPGPFVGRLALEVQLKLAVDAIIRVIPDAPCFVELITLPLDTLDSLEAQVHHMLEWSKYVVPVVPNTLTGFEVLHRFVQQSRQIAVSPVSTQEQIGAYSLLATQARTTLVALVTASAASVSAADMLYTFATHTPRLQIGAAVNDVAAFRVCRAAQVPYCIVTPELYPEVKDMEMGVDEVFGQSADMVDFEVLQTTFELSDIHSEALLKERETLWQSLLGL